EPHPAKFRTRRHQPTDSGEACAVSANMDSKRITSIGLRAVVAWENHRGPQINWPPMERSQKIRPYADVLDVLVIGREAFGLYDLRQIKPDRCSMARVQMHPLNLAVLSPRSIE